MGGTGPNQPEVVRATGTDEPADQLGGLLSALMVGAVILAINVAPVPDSGTLVLAEFAQQDVAANRGDAGNG